MRPPSLMSWPALSRRSEKTKMQHVKSQESGISSATALSFQGKKNAYYFLGFYTFANGQKEQCHKGESESRAKPGRSQWHVLFHLLPLICYGHHIPIFHCRTNFVSVMWPRQTFYFSVKFSVMPEAHNMMTMYWHLKLFKYRMF